MENTLLPAMIRLSYRVDLWESFSYICWRYTLRYRKPRTMGSMPMPLPTNSLWIEGVLKWAKTYISIAITVWSDNDDNVELFRQHGIIAIAQDYKQGDSRRYPTLSATSVNRENGRRVFLGNKIPCRCFYVNATRYGRKNAARFYWNGSGTDLGNNFHAYQEQRFDDWVV